MKYICKECGSDNIHVKMWVNPNTNEIGEWCKDDFGYPCWCEKCQDITEYETDEEGG